MPFSRFFRDNQALELADKIRVVEKNTLSAGVRFSGTSMDEDRALLLGMGRNSITGENANWAVSGSENQARSERGELHGAVSLITSKKHLASSLRLTLSANFDVWGASASADVGIVNTTSFDAYSVNILVSVKVHLRKYILYKPQFTDAARPFLDKEYHQQFLQTYGDQFLSGVTVGGEVYLLYSFQNSTEKVRRNLSAIVSGEYAGSNATETLKTKFESLNSNKAFSIQIVSRVADTVHIPEKELREGDPSATLQFAENIEKMIRDSSGIDVAYEYTGYNVPEGRTPAQPDFPNFHRTVDYLDTLSDRKTEIDNWLSTASYCLQNRMEFVEFSDSDLLAMMDRGRIMLREVDRSAADLIAEPWKTPPTEVPFSVTALGKLPELRSYGLGERLTVKSRSMIVTVGGDEWAELSGRSSIEELGIELPDGLRSALQAEVEVAQNVIILRFPNRTTIDRGLSGELLPRSLSNDPGIIGVRFTIVGELSKDYSLRYAARFSDGFESDNVESGTGLGVLDISDRRTFRGKIVGLKVSLRRR